MRVEKMDASYIADTRKLYQILRQVIKMMFLSTCQER